MSSTNDANHAPAKAVDNLALASYGYFSYNSMAYTQSESTPWWEVDLGSSKDLNSIRIWNRTEYNSYTEGNMANVYVFVSDTAFTSQDLTNTINQSGVSNYFISGALGVKNIVNIGRNGRYVRIQRSDTGRLQLTEVQIFENE